MHYIDTLHAEVENWKNKYDLAMVCYKDEETTHTATLARLVEAQEQNAELLAALEILVGWHDHTDFTSGLNPLERLALARAAIAKAKGENNQ